MAKAQNQVIAGDYQGKIVCLNRAGLYIALNITGSKMVMLDKSQVESYEQIKELISVDTLKTMQLLGFNYKAAIGEPLTEICANAISKLGNKTTVSKRK